MARKPITKSNPYTPKSGQFAGRTFDTERKYRDALAQKRGFANYSQQVKASPRQRKIDNYIEIYRRDHPKASRVRAIEGMKYRLIRRSPELRHITDKEAQEFFRSERFRDDWNLINGDDELLKEMAFEDLGITDTDYRLSSGAQAMTIGG